ncbi:kynurenine 3-monooxygenase [Plectosphaerella cucumerina]|uniref:Kynurenine 3-monooxygenase n=1 Tax=Plectosphaerella cucumerina TaxID=40658 RepID=A0A8K0TBF9_9PEZI|nr:kynurenine 3-monooxygenase [Plectosphaerella cucumerina]
MRHAGQPGLLEHVFAATIPMRGRMIHGRGPTGSLYEASQNYDIHGRAIYAVDRAGLNKRLLDILENMPNVRFFFSHKLTGADFKARKAWFEVMTSESATGRAREIEIDFDLMIGADGAHSAVRYHMMKYVQMNYRQDYIDTLWCEFHIEPRAGAALTKTDPGFQISPNHLHIWPGKDFMFIAIPSTDGSFTSTLFLPSAEVLALERDPAQLPAFFDKHFPGVTDLIPPKALVSQFTTNPHLPLISVKCSPYHHRDSAVIVGDAAHAMVPFYGQGMNTGLEDVRVLFSILDKHADRETNNPEGQGEDDASSSATAAYHRQVALAEYTANRVADAHAINDLALQNYVEMRSSVLSPRYRLRKWLEEKLSVYFPALGWHTKYSRVSFSNERYSEVVRKSDRQGDILMVAFEALVASPVVLAAAYIWWRRPQRVVDAAQNLVRWMVGREQFENLKILNELMYS